MEILILSTLFLLHANQVLGIDSNSLAPRTICYSQDQRGCNREFTDVYPKLSKSATNMTKADTFFMLFTRKNRDKPENLHKCGGRLPPNTNYNPRNRLIIIPNSFGVGYCDTAAFREWTAQILAREDANVLAIDFSWGSRVEYGTAILNSRIVAKQTVIVLKNIKKDHTLNNSGIYIIGHSLAGQLAGMIGSMFKVGRISGIDPAGPGFDEKKTSLKYRLDPTDADLVDVWHTNAGNCIPFLGINYDAGHVDFYVDGGSFQSGCYSHAFTSVLKGDFLSGIASLVAPNVCSHLFATELFKVSINPGKCQFVGVQCQSKIRFKTGVCNFCGKNGERCAIMGFDLDKYYIKPRRIPERYYVKTGNLCPYCTTRAAVRLQGFKKTYNELTE